MWLKSTSLGGRLVGRLVGRPAGRPGAGGIGTKTNSAPNCCWDGVGVEAELGNEEVNNTLSQPGSPHDDVLHLFLLYFQKTEMFDEVYVGDDGHDDHAVFQGVTSSQLNGPNTAQLS